MSTKILLGAVLAVAGLGAAEKPHTAQDVLRAVNSRLEREFIGHDGLLLDYVGDIPTPQEIADLKPNAMAWWCPIENGSMFAGEWLPALMAEGAAKKALVERCVKGLIKMSEVSDVPGFIARGTGTDGKSHHPCGSNDQTDPWFLGLCEYCRWPHADPALKAKVRDRLVFVARALEANGWGVPCDGAFKGENRGNLNAKAMPFWGKSRLLYTLKSLHLLTGDAHWGELYGRIKADCIAEIEAGGEVDANRFKACFDSCVWIYVASAQMLARLIELENDGADRARMRKGLLHYAERVSPQMKLCSQYDNAKVRPFKYANWREGYNWRPQKTQKEAEAVAYSPKREVLGDRKEHERKFMANPLAAAAVCALADRDKYRDAVMATLRHYDYETPNISEFFHAAIAAAAMLPSSRCAVAPDGRVDVRAFGAVGDGVHDDTAAFQMAFDVVDRFSRTDDRSWGGGVVGGAAPEICLRAGTYRITRPIVAGRSFTLRGEKGAVIDAKGVKGPALYVDRMWRCTIEGMTFRNGESHVAFWTHNDDTASITIKDCRFENAEKEAVWTESWRSEPVKDDAGKVVKRSEYTAPFDVVRDDAGMPVLKPLSWKSSAPNSTRFTMHDCEMIDCGAAYRGATDGQEISRVFFRSSRPQALPPFASGCECQMTDVRIVANIPEGFAKGWIDGNRGNYVLTRVVARSSTAFGAPLLVTEAPPRQHRGGVTYGMANHVDVWNCEADSANSPSGTFLDFRRRAPALLHVRGCTESKGAAARLIRVGEVPTDLESMRDAGGHCEDNVPLELTHRWLFEDNGKSFDLQTPAIFAPCFEKPLPYAAFAGYPEADAKIDNPRSASNTVFRACDYGIGIDRGNVVDEAGKLERLFAAATKAENPLVELPGRTIGLSRAITLPRRISIQGVGRVILRGLNASNDLFRVEKGDAPIAIDFDNVGFVNGRFAIVASGAGRIHVQNAVFAVNRGLAVAERGGTLDVTVIDSTVYSQQIALVDGATFRMRDSWVEFLAARPPFTFVDNARGTVVLERLCGVPITGSNPGKIERHKNLPEGEYMFWIRNEDGIVRSREFRYGGEFGGIAPVDNYGKGRAMIETGFTTAVNGGTIPCIYRNNSPEGRVTLNRVMLLGIGWAPPHVGHGVRPLEEWRSGLRLNRDEFKD